MELRQLNLLSVSIELILIVLKTIFTVSIKIQLPVAICKFGNRRGNMNYNYFREFVESVMSGKSEKNSDF